MLRIAEYNKITGKKVELKELEKFGFKPKYNEDNGEIRAYQKKCEKDIGGLLISIVETTSLIRIYKAFKKTESRMAN